METPNIYAGILAEQSGKLLLIQHDNPGGPDFHTAPAALVEGRSSLRKLAKDACFLQTGLLIEPKELLYIEESQSGERAFYFWFRGDCIAGEALQHTAENGESSEAVWLNQQEMDRISTIRPAVLQYDYWQRKPSDSECPRYILL